MRDSINIGSSPIEEDCAQVGSPDYHERARVECKRFKEQIERHYPEPEMGYLRVKGFSHDFGTYYEVIACYDSEDAESTTWAFDIEGDKLGCLQTWDTQTEGESK